MPLFHFDMYRLEGAEDLFDIGWEDYLARGGVCAVEWSEQAADALPPDAVTRHPRPPPGGRATGGSSPWREVLLHERFWPWRPRPRRSPPP